ncbi:hypothetical protein [Burkholderia contaminans]|uniref:hypothetical protein n=1 Tax=Burkholderia contaminans TaxID=488447 RepID=UPI002D7F2992|nr:hypothetical protein [Burkholderia contaminans]
MENRIMKISESIKASVATDPDPQRWAVLAGALGEAIVQRALAMSPGELRSFIGDTEAGRRMVGASENELASAACIVRMALL